MYPEMIEIKVLATGVNSEPRTWNKGSLNFSGYI